MRASAKMTTMRPAVATTSASSRGHAGAIGRAPGDRRRGEHHVREDGAADASDAPAPADRPPPSSTCRRCSAMSTRVTTGLKCAPETVANTRMSTARPECRRERVLEELQADVRRREALCGDPGADDDRGESCAAEELSRRQRERMWLTRRRGAARPGRARPGTSVKYAHVPRLLRVRKPALVRILRWCDTVGWLSPTGSMRSQTHASSVLRGGHDRQQPQPRRICQRLHRQRQLLGVLGGVSGSRTSGVQQAPAVTSVTSSSVVIY